MKSRFLRQPLTIGFGMLILAVMFLGIIGCADQNNMVLPEDWMSEELGVLYDSGFAADLVTLSTPVLDMSQALKAPGSYSKVKLDVPFIPQVSPGNWSNTKNCGQASVLNVVGYLRRQCMASFNITYENDWLAKTYNEPRYKDPNGWYTNTTKLVNLAQNYWGYWNSVAGNGTLDIVYAELKANRPVVVAVRLNMSTNPQTLGHFMALVGMDNSTVWMNDVGRSQGKDRAFPLSQFQKSWATQGNAYISIK
ncbi:MAG: C39 family peptidase [Candidatus Poribacteria bacterium]